MAETPPTGHVYRLKSRATGFFLWGQSHPQQEFTVLGRPELIDNRSDWLLESSEFGFRLRSMDNPNTSLDSNLERQVYLMVSNDGSFQQWRLLDGDDEGFWSLQNVATGFALDGNLDHDIFTMRRNDGAFQRWQFQLVQ